MKSPNDVITDGFLAYGVNVGRFVFEEEGYTVYVITDLSHIAASDVLMVYQISKEDYDVLVSLSHSNRVPNLSISTVVTDACRRVFLCGESAYCKRYYCSLDDVDMSLAVKTLDDVSINNSLEETMNYCPNCGTKNDGNNYCIKCGKKLTVLWHNVVYQVFEKQMVY